MSKHDFTFNDLEALLDAAPQDDRFRNVDAKLIRRMSDMDLRHVKAATRASSELAQARLHALAEQVLADRANRSNRLTMWIATASLVATIIGTIVTVILA